MTTYQITNTCSGLDLGTYEGETPDAAIRAMYDDAGYQGVAIDEIPGAGADTLDAVEVA